MEVLAKKLTYQEFQQLEFDDNDNYWYELINGELVRKQSPTITHQRISKRIERFIEDHAIKTDSGEMFHAPLDVVFDDNNAYHPDIFFIKKERSFIIDEKEQVVIGSPDLIVKILSKSTAAYDRGDKKDVYEKYGVKEYWLVDPPKKVIEVYQLKEDRFKLVSYLEERGILKSSVLDEFEMEISKVFD